MKVSYRVCLALCVVGVVAALDLGEGDMILRSRSKRQSGNLALDLAGSHQNHKGIDRPVGRIHGRFDLQGSGQSARRYVANGGVGAGSVLWRSKNNRHSLGAGAYVGQTRARFDNFRFKSKPDFGVGLGYKFRF